jgi:hypothetical protein
MSLGFQIVPTILKEITLYLKSAKTVMATIHTGRAESKLHKLNTLWCRLLRLS